MNTKFEKFLDLVFKSTMPTFDVKDEIVKYVQALETSYMDAINDLKILIDKEKDRIVKNFSYLKRYLILYL